MNSAAIFHRPSREFVMPISITEISFRLLCATNDIDKVSMCFWKRGFKKNKKIASLKLYCQDFYRDDYRIVLTFEERAHYIQYYFILEKNGKEYYFSNEGIYENNPSNKGWFEYQYTNTNEIFVIPVWATGITYYQIFPDRFARDHSVDDKSLIPWNSVPTTENVFGGTLKGINENLPYLVELGIQAIYLCPIFKGNFNHKYATTDYYLIDPSFGSEIDLKDLVDNCHNMNIKVILDGVFNHVGLDFDKFKQFRAKGLNKDWFFPLDIPNSVSKVNYECVGDYYPMPKLKTSNSEVREFILSIMCYWIDNCNIDGWRIDVADEIDISTLQYLRINLKRKFPNQILLGETWGDGFRNVGMGDQLDCVMNYQFRNVVIDLFAKQNIDCATFRSRIGHILNCYHDNVNKCNYNLLSSHDVPRFLTECNNNLELFHLSICFQMTFIGSPAIYYGDENNMVGENDPGCRGSMNFNKESATFKLYKNLIHLRKTNYQLRYGNFEFEHNFCALNSFAFKRSYEGQSIIVIFNLGEQYLEIDIEGKELFSYPKSDNYLNKIIESKSMKIILLKEESNGN